MAHDSVSEAIEFYTLDSYDLYRFVLFLPDGKLALSPLCAAQSLLLFIGQRVITSYCHPHHCFEHDTRKYIMWLIHCYFCRKNF